MEKGSEELGREGRQWVWVMRQDRG
jgi:hypothetical protein